MHEQPLADVDLPIVREIGEALYAAALAADAHGGVWAGRGPGARARRKDGSRAKRRHGLRHPPLMALVTLSALVLAAGIAAAGSLVGGIGITPDEWLSGKRAQPPTAITADQAMHLAILRRPRDPAWDAVNPEEAAQLSHGTFTGAAGADFALSRRVRGLQAGAAWVVPGAGRVCLIASLHVGKQTPVGETHGGANCKPTPEVRRKHVILLVRSARATDKALIAGLVPDGISMVVVGRVKGPAIRVAVHENVYLAGIPGTVTSLRFLGPSRTFEDLRLFAERPLRRRPGSCVRHRRDLFCSGR